MKILVLYRYTFSSSLNYWCNVDFYKELNKFEDTEVKFYGVDVHQLFPDITLTPYNPKLMMSNLRDLFDFDVIIIAGRNRTFTNFREIYCWLPKDFNNFDCPKVLVEPDYHKYRKLDWYKELNISLILHRHKSNVIRAEEDFPHFRNLWFPFSVDSNIFKPDENITRIKKICFVGNSKSKSYYYRQKASEKLNEENLLIFEGIQKELNYPLTLQKYIAYLNGASLFSIDCAKSFEILSSGGILFTNNAHNGFNELFPNCYITYENNFSDIKEKAKHLLNDSSLCNKLSKKGRQLILNNHTHYHRCKDLLEILKREIINKNDYQFIKNNINDKVDVVYNIGNLDSEALLRFKNSYLSLSKNKYYNIKISEVGQNNTSEKIKEFIPNFEYYYQYAENFDASIAKNNAFKYLIKENLFSFLDIDMIVPSNFIEKIILFYKRYNKSFICPYIRLKQTSLTDYDELIFQINEIGEEKITSSGVLVCDKEIYKNLNGFDEDYKDWGGRDSDFYERARLINKFKIFYNCCLLHQYHERNFGKNKEKNKERYNNRILECSNNKNLITKFKGLIDNRNNAILQIKTLLAHNISVCLLEQSCYQGATNKQLSTPLILGVNNIEKASLLVSNIKFKSFPSKTKKLKLQDIIVDIPYPVVSYLRNLYGKKIEKELKK